MKRIALLIVAGLLLISGYSSAQPGIDSATREVDRSPRKDVEKESWLERKKKIKLEEKTKEETSEEETEDDTPKIIIDRT